MNKQNPIDLALQACGCSQVELAKRLGVSPSLVSIWKMRGYVTQKHLSKAVEVTGLPAYLLNRYVPVTRVEITKAS